MTKICENFKNKVLAFFFLSIAFVFFSSFSLRAADLNAQAPDFTATDIHGKTFHLGDQKGKIVVLEWTNSECPFVKKHYESGNMQKAQKSTTERGVVWVSIVSSAPGKQGHVAAAEALRIEKEVGAHATTRILDESGEIGRLYSAKTTPHMFVIDAQGKLAYAGAIDNHPDPDPKSVEGADNYVLNAVDDLLEGRPLKTPETAPYGCGVKY